MRFSCRLPSMETEQTRTKPSEKNDPSCQLSFGSTKIVYKNKDIQLLSHVVFVSEICIR